MRARRPHGEAGFTLIEVLVSLVLLATMLALLPGTLGLGRRVWERTPALAAHDAAAATRLLLAQRLSSALMVFESGPDGRFGVAFRGDADGLMFVSEEPAGPFGGGRYRSELGRTPTGDVVLVSSPLVRTGGGDAIASPVVLARNTAGMKLRYYSDGRTPGWVEDWTSATTLPALIEIEISGGDATPATAIVVAPRLR